MKEHTPNAWSRRGIACWPRLRTALTATVMAALIVALVASLEFGAAAPAWAMNATQADRLAKAANSGDHEALARLRQAAAQGFAVAQYNLGVLYEHGRGVAQDDAKAAFWYRKAAAQGDFLAQNNLGFLYERGHGMPQDYAKAAFWYRKATAQGDAMAEYNLGVLFEHGHGVAQDDAKAAFWYRKAAAQGYAVAQNNLGALYEHGKGVAQDYSKAAFWYRKAAAQGKPGEPIYTAASKAVRFMALRMPPAQIGEAQAAAAAWARAHPR